MQVKRINFQDEDNQLFEILKKKHNITNTELISMLLSNYVERQKLENEIQYIKEAVLLLIKANKSLPMMTQEQEMYNIVFNQSRFENLLEDKVIKNESEKL